jgi:soluble lytic murein transglycosylase-like protein
MSQDYSSLIRAAAAQYGVDPNLALAVAQQESGGKQYNSAGRVLTSPQGAMGIMQLLPSTAAGLGVDPTDPAANVDGGVKLLAQLLQQFNGNTSLALAAYDAGPAAVQTYGGIPPYAETQNYVASILAMLDSSPPDPRREIQAPRPGSQT